MLINYFYSFVNNAELENERDESFIELITDNLFDTTILNGIQKHNISSVLNQSTTRTK